MGLERTQVLAQGAEGLRSEKINQVVDWQVFLHASFLWLETASCLTRVVRKLEACTCECIATAFMPPAF